MRRTDLVCKVEGILREEIAKELSDGERKMSAAFSPLVAESLLVKAARCCCLCRQFKGTKLEIHHIDTKAEGGLGAAKNGIPLCFDCHADVKNYNDEHPKGRKYTPSELMRHRDAWFALMASPQAIPTLLADPAYRAEILTRVTERIDEGKSIQSAMKTIPGEWRENWVKWYDTHHKTPDRFEIDYSRFVQWRLRCLALQKPLGEINEMFGLELGKFVGIECCKSHLEFAIATLEGIKQELTEGGIPIPPLQSSNG